MENLVFRARGNVEPAHSGSGDLNLSNLVIDPPQSLA